MNIATGIEWTDATSNPFKFRDRETGEIVWACVKKSAGCANCYAETLAKRYGRGGPFTNVAMEKVEPFVCEKELKQLLTSTKLAGKKVFVGDMTDIFGEWVTDEMLDKFFHTIENRPNVIFQLLTKRADRMKKYLSWRWGEGRIPSRHIWCGVSVENQAVADERIPLLLETPAAVRFLSCEPLIGAVDLTKCWMSDKSGWWNSLTGKLTCRIKLNAGGEAWGETEKPLRRPLDWIIIGGESGPGARPCNVDWIRSLVEQCSVAGVAAFVKQLGGYVQDKNARIERQFPESMCWPTATAEDDADHIRITDLKNKKGGDPDEWPEDLRIREFPKAVLA